MRDEIRAQKGDDWLSLAIRHKLSVSDLINANPNMSLKTGVYLNRPAPNIQPARAQKYQADRVKNIRGLIARKNARFNQSWKSKLKRAGRRSPR